MSAYHRHLARTRAIQRDRRAWRDEPPCWCGEPHPLYLTDGLRPTCGGTGELECLCGGDLCVCHHHGSVPCDGCDDCDGNDDEWWDEDEDDLDPHENMYR